MAHGTADDYVQRIRERAGYVRSDMRTFFWARMQKAFKEHNLGGGNVMCALAAFALLGVLAKVHYALKKPRKRFAFPDDERAMKERRPFEVSERDAFWSLIKWLKTESIDIGIPDSVAAGLIWEGYRDWLAHRLDTTHLILTTDFGETMTLEILEKGLPLFMQNGQTSFRPPGDMPINRDRWAFVVEFFYPAIVPMVAALEARLRSGPLDDDTRVVLDNLLLRIEPERSRA